MTGIGSFLQRLLEEIAGARRHLTTIALTLPGAALPLQAPHIRVHPLPEARALYCDQVVLPRVLREEDATLFFSPYYKTPLVAPCPTVITVHDLIPLSFPAYARGAWRLRAVAFRAWAGLMARRAAAVITDSLHSREEVVRMLGLAPERVHVVPVGVGGEFRPAPPGAAATVLARYGISKPYVLAVGNFLPHKNFLGLTEAYGTLPGTVRRSTSLVLAGTPAAHGAARPTDPKAIARPGVHLPGFISPEDLPLLYAGALALVCPSLSEGFGLPVLEAMACGTPVVCARAGALPEVAGDAAVYVDPADVASIAAGLRRILEDEGLRRTLTSRGLQRARLFGPRQTASRLVDLLEELGAVGKGG
jgi:alpha-1,3-rhamnosyl/mannosyltransferase